MEPNEILDSMSHLFGLVKKDGQWVEISLKDLTKCEKCRGNGYRISKRFKMYRCHKCRGTGYVMKEPVSK